MAQPNSLSIPQLAQTKARLPLSIVIVNWNTRDLLAACLHSVLDEAKRSRVMGGVANIEVIVVDNASTDGSAEMLRRDFPQVKLIANTGNPGFARANNQALRECGGEYVMLLNPDTEILSGALDGLLLFLQNQLRIGVVAPRILNTDRSLQESVYPLPTLGRELWRMFHLDKLRPLGIYPMRLWDTNTPREVESALGACLLIRREVLVQIGLLDEDYFIYSEEIDWCQRARNAGWQIWWVPQAMIVHHGGQSTGQVRTEMFLQLYRGKVIYFRKHHGNPITRMYKGVLMGATVARLSLSPIAWLQRSPRRERQRHLAHAYGRLLVELPKM